VTFPVSLFHFSIADRIEKPKYVCFDIYSILLPINRVVEVVKVISGIAAEFLDAIRILIFNPGPLIT
jgi:hypothetical protein